LGRGFERKEAVEEKKEPSIDQRELFLSLFRFASIRFSLLPPSRSPAATSSTSSSDRAVPTPPTMTGAAMVFEVFGFVFKVS
jgi:hypothetical protein